jgi:hypothetical protein
VGAHIETPVHRIGAVSEIFSHVSFPLLLIVLARPTTNLLFASVFFCAIVVIVDPRSWPLPQKLQEKPHLVFIDNYPRALYFRRRTPLKHPKQWRTRSPRLRPLARRTTRRTSTALVAAQARPRHLLTIIIITGRPRRSTHWPPRLPNRRRTMWVMANLNGRLRNHSNMVR